MVFEAIRSIPRMASQNQTPNQFEAYFRRADTDQDGRISGLEAVANFKGSNLPQPVLAQIWTYADQNRTGFLGRQEFYNALKLVSVAQKRELTPELVKAALFTPASAKIPAPQINLAAIPGPQLTNKVGAVVPPVSGATPTTAITSGIRGQQGLPAQRSHYIRPPRPLNPNPGFQSQPDVSGQGILVGSTLTAPRPPSSSNWLAGRNGGSQAGVTTHTPNSGVSPRSNNGFPLAALTATPQQTQREATSSVLPGLSKSSDTSLLGKQPKATVSNAVPVKGNGFASDSLFGDAFSVAAVQPKQNYTPTISSGSNIAVSSATDPASRGPQPLLTASSVDSQVILPQQQAHQHQQSQLTVRPIQQVSVQSSAAHSSAGGNSLPGQSQLPWPRMTQSDYQRYSKIFMAVDKDRDGKITGDEARNLFLSWKLPREILRQVWELSDQDNDSMLSLREFCIALYLMGRHREGRPLPSVLPTNLMFDETSLPSGQPTGAHGVVAWGHTPGFQQTQGPRGARQAAPGALGKPPRPAPIPQPDEAVQPVQQKPKVPVLEKHLVDQLSTEEQDSLNSKFQKATDAEKKVMELEKEILDAKEKNQFYHTKMQELVNTWCLCLSSLYKIVPRIEEGKI